MLRNTVGGGILSDFPEKKSVTKMYGSTTFLALRGGELVSNFQTKTLRNT